MTPIILRLLLAEKRLSFDALASIACCSVDFRKECLPYKQLYYKYCWQKKIDISHQIILKAAQVIWCVSKGDKTFSSICTRPSIYDEDYDNHNTKIKLETIIHFAKITEREYIDGSCDYYYSDDPDFQAEPVHSCQHIDFGWLSLSLKNIEQKTRWINDEGLLTESDACEFCSCYHCKTYGVSPDEDCKCPKCSDPITGHSYWSKLLWPA